LGSLHATSQAGSQLAVHAGSHAVVQVGVSQLSLHVGVWLDDVSSVEVLVSPPELDVSAWTLVSTAALPSSASAAPGRAAAAKVSATVVSRSRKRRVGCIMLPLITWFCKSCNTL
jgi:hypothetical protein